MRAVRDGLHAGAAQYARVNSVPTLASLSMFGVWTSGRLPRHPTQWFRSSMAIKSTFGGVSSAAREAGAYSSTAAAAARDRRMQAPPQNEDSRGAGRGRATGRTRG